LVAVPVAVVPTAVPEARRLLADSSPAQAEKADREDKTPAAVPEDPQTDLMVAVSAARVPVGPVLCPATAAVVMAVALVREETNPLAVLVNQGCSSYPGDDTSGKINHLGFSS
jgi:hypothetical protein